MNIEERIAACEQRFNELGKQLEEITAERARLQGEYGVLVELRDNPPDTSKPEKVDKASTVEVMPEGEVA